MSQLITAGGGTSFLLRVIKSGVLLSAAILFCQPALTGATAQAQERGSGGRSYRSPYSGLLSYLRTKQVQQELELVEEQREAVDDLMKETSSKMRTMYSGLRDLPATERTERYYEKMGELAAESEKKMHEILLPHQVDRLKQLALRMSLRTRGTVYTLGQSDLADALGISEEQRQKLREKQQEMQKQLTLEYHKLRAQMQDQLLESVLTPGQLAKLKELQGEPSK